VIVGEGKPGPITKKLQATYFDLIEGRRPDTIGLLTYI
jgi:hypothetical protein